MADPPFDPDQLEQQLAVKLTMTALQGGEGSVTATRQVLEILDRIRSRQAAAEHQKRMRDTEGEPLELIRYLGYLGEGAREVERTLGRSLSEEERTAYEEGRRRRQLEIRAVELDRAVRGQGKPAPWMRG